MASVTQSTNPTENTITATQSILNSAEFTKGQEAFREMAGVVRNIATTIREVSHNAARNAMLDVSIGADNFARGAKILSVVAMKGFVAGACVALGAVLNAPNRLEQAKDTTVDAYTRTRASVENAVTKAIATAKTNVKEFFAAAREATLGKYQNKQIEVAEKLSSSLKRDLIKTLVQLPENEKRAFIAAFKKTVEGVTQDLKALSTSADSRGERLAKLHEFNTKTFAFATRVSEYVDGQLQRKEEIAKLERTLATLKNQGTKEFADIKGLLA